MTPPSDDSSVPQSGQLSGNRFLDDTPSPTRFFDSETKDSDHSSKADSDDVDDVTEFPQT